MNFEDLRMMRIMPKIKVNDSFVYTDDGLHNEEEDWKNAFM